MALKLDQSIVVVREKLTRFISIHSYSVDTSSLEVTLGIKGEVEGSLEVIGLPQITLKPQEVIDAMTQAVREIVGAAAALWGISASDAEVVDIAIQSQPDLAWKLYYSATRNALYGQVKRSIDEQAKVSSNAGSVDGGDQAVSSNATS